MQHEEVHIGSQFDDPDSDELVFVKKDAGAPIEIVEEDEIIVDENTPPRQSETRRSRRSRKSNQEMEILAPDDANEVDI